jgi:tetratricopeptide (TPR) repeat protein
MFRRYSLAFYIISALSIPAAIQPALADAEADARAKDENDPSLDKCTKSAVMAHLPVVAGDDVNKENSEKAIADCKVIAEVGRSQRWRAFAFQRIGESQMDLGAYRQALDSLSKSLELNSSDHGTYIDRGDVYKKLRLTNKAASDYERAASLSVGNGLFQGNAFLRLAILYNDDRQYDLAIAYINKAIELAPDESKYNLYKNRGTIYLNKGDSERAQADFAKSIDLKFKR